MPVDESVFSTFRDPQVVGMTSIDVLKGRP
jgi:hypothetical protein